MRLSVVIPVYNVERYLERCVQSVLAQDIDDCEVLLIDDGSTDRSGELCDALQRRYGCVSVVHQPNGGLSAARNSGIDRARGEYITFVDSDDELCPDTLKGNLDFLIAHPEVDMLEYPVEVHAESAGAYMLTFPDETQQANLFADWIRREGYLHCYACNKIYRKRLWHSLRFPVGQYFEDVAVMPDIIRQCHCIHYSSRGCYRYIMHPGTITTVYSYARLRQFFEATHRLYLDIKDNESCRTHTLRLWISCLNRLIDMGRCNDADEAGYACAVRDAESNRPPYSALLRGAPDVATRLKLLPLPLLGLRTYCRLYALLTKSLSA